jgi:hypothetical protein
MLRAVLAASVSIGLCALSLGPSQAQTPARAAATGSRVQANLAQLMKGLLYPNANIVFAAQSDNPADVKPAKDPGT